MKKIVFALLITLIATSATAQKINNLDDLIAHFSKSKNADYATLDRTMDISNFLPEMNSSIDSLQVLDLSKCSKKTKEKFLKIYQKGFENYLTLVKNDREDATFARVFMKQSGDKINELIFFDSSEPLILRLIGDFNKEYLKEIQIQSLQ